ncbi:hypothetical protein OH76DRAFT_588768 [Lentinus brumalis]|uniref:Uncharacterized protein n=1 Tax=Lentinus brumalis TaxID=2498619 RepID=A0A371DTX7_9APHY|nr:hypothetical protein OH76DRAFT_588768 [Polyporus brumalis]
MRPSRARTPRARTSSAQDSRRASSVPAGGSSKPEWILDCVLLPPRKRKRTNTHEEPQPNGEMTRADPPRSDIKKLPKRVTRSQTRDDAPPSARTRSRSTARAASSAHTSETRARRRAASSTRAVSEAPSASPSAARPRRTSARTSTALGKLASTSRGSVVPASASVLVTRRGRTSEKGKARARPAASDVSTTASVDDNWEVDSSASRTRRNVKRRRVSPPQLALRLDLDATEQDDAWDSQKTVVEDDFHMMDGPPDTLPWIPVNPHSEGSEYVPPGVNALIEDMKRALVVHRSERERVENSAPALAREKSAAASTLGTEDRQIRHRFISATRPTARMARYPAKHEAAVTILSCATSYVMVRDEVSRCRRFAFCI